MRIQIDLTPEESADIKALAIRFGTTPKQILTQFASDFTGSLRTRGSDERDHAMQYVERAFFDRQTEYTCGEPLTEKEQEKIELLHSEAWRHRENQSAAWRATVEATLKQEVK